MAETLQQVARQCWIVVLVIDQAVGIKQKLQMMQVGGAIGTPTIFTIGGYIRRFVLVRKLPGNGFAHVYRSHYAFYLAELVRDPHQLTTRPFPRIHQATPASPFVHNDGASTAQQAHGSRSDKDGNK